MKDTLHNVFSLLDSDEIEERTPCEVAQYSGRRLGSFDDLVDDVARLGFRNPNLDLYFRGQLSDYPNKEGCDRQRTVLLPQAFRESISIDEEESREYLEQILPRMTSDLVSGLKGLPSWKSRPDRISLKGMQHFKESLWTILQHYECPTPLLDVTQSLSVASWFATHEYPKDELSEKGYIYVVGLPRIHDHISFFPYESLVIVKLQSACPPEAKRPHNQEGYLVGSIPHTPKPHTYKYRDFALRLVAKFRINSPKDYWDSVGNSRLCAATLCPEKDRMAEIVNEIRKTHVDPYLRLRRPSS